jgi:TLD
MIFFCPESSQKSSDAPENKEKLQLDAALPQQQFDGAQLPGATNAMRTERRRPALLDDANDEDISNKTRLNSYGGNVRPPHQESLIGFCRRVTIDSVDATRSCCYTASGARIHKTSDHQLRRLVGDIGMALFAPLEVEGLATTTTTSFDDSERRDDHNPDCHPEPELEPTPPTCFISRKHSAHAKIRRQHLQEKHPRLLTSSEGSLTTATAGETDCEDDEEDDYNDCWILPVPLMSCPRILTPHMLQQLSVHLPLSCQGHMLERCFCIGEHGDSILSMLYQCRMFRYTVMVIQTTNGDVIGGFATANWNDKRHNVYYGDGQSFLFTTVPGVSMEARELCGFPFPNPTMAVFPWSGENDYCQICDPDQNRIAMGGEGDFGLIVRDNFSFGETGCSRTYRNPPLVPTGRFEIAAFEVYGIVPYSLSPQRFTSTTS